MGEFATIVADPPWKVAAGRSIGAYRVESGKQLFGVTDNGARRLAYPHMDVDAIKRLPVAEHAANDAHLYLWTINRYIREAYAVVEAWGFTPSTLLTWAKKPMGGGLGSDAYGLSTEFCLFARRGKCPAVSRVGTSWFNWKRPYLNGYPRHSAKPHDFFQMVEQVSPGPFLELFARDKRDGWKSWGNEVESDITMPLANAPQEDTPDAAR